MKETPCSSFDLTLRCPRCQRVTPQAQAEGLACPGCDAHFPVIDGIPSLLLTGFDGAVRERYESAARTGEAVARTVGYRFDRQHRLMERTLHQVLEPLRAAHRILDVGCGHGLLSRSLTKQHQVVGVDFALGMLRLARDNGLTAYHADVTCLPFADDQFDICLCAEVIQHFEDSGPLFAEMARVCRPGGRVVVSTLNRSSLLRRLFRLVKALDPNRKALPMMRTAQQLIGGAARAPLTPRTVVWTHYPCAYVRLGTDARYRASALATNVIVDFVKEGEKGKGTNA